ncbi:MAG: rhodanese-like domain-containing protein [Prevotella sp.]|jgi:rhodanese-related sulfurtransferase|nr:rhodanese-like domain-containing protein [Prevotella sp.]
MSFFSDLFNTTPSQASLKKMLENGAILLDVRSRAEFEEGHAEGSENIPLDELDKAFSKFDKDQTFVVVCASGIRSRDAVSRFKKQNYMNVYNGNSWSNFI